MNLASILNTTMHEWESAFPGQIRSWYLIGSHADSTAGPASDIDLIFTLEDGFHESLADVSRGAEVTDRLKCLFPDTRIESWGESEGKFIQTLPRSTDFALCLHRVSLKLGSKLLKGPDIRDRIVVPEAHEYGAALRHSTEGWFTKLAKGSPESDERERYVLDGNLKVFTSWVLSYAASAAFEASRTFMPKKSDFAPAYDRAVGGRWSPWIMDVHQTVWKNWGCRLPMDEADQFHLGEIFKCARRFEQAFLARAPLKP